MLSPIALTTVADRGQSAETTTVTLGGGARPDSALYLRFASGYKSVGDVAAAFLLLTPAPGTETREDDVSLQVTPVASAWSTDSLARGERPKTSTPAVTGLARTRPASLVRIDVTEVVQTLARAPADAGMAVTAAGSHGAGVTLVTAAADAPRLDVYLAQSSTSRTPW